MSSYVLDTNALVWAAQSPDFLGKKARRILDTAIDVRYSSLSIAEMEMKAMLGKYSSLQDFEDQLKKRDFVEEPFTSKHAINISRFGSLVRHEPFDRMILAQAAAENCLLITADQTLLDLGFDWILDARQ